MKKAMLVLLLLLLLIPRNAFALCSYYSTRFHTWPFAGVVMGVVWVILIVGTVYLLVRAAGNHRYFPREPYQEDPLEILKRRYARGEISRDEYEQMKKDLTG